MRSLATLVALALVLAVAAAGKRANVHSFAPLLVWSGDASLVASPSTSTSSLAGVSSLDVVNYVHAIARSSIAWPPAASPSPAHLPVLARSPELVVVFVEASLTSDEFVRSGAKSFAELAETFASAPFHARTRLVDVVAPSALRLADVASVVVDLRASVAVNGASDMSVRLLDYTVAPARLIDAETAASRHSIRSLCNNKHSDVVLVLLDDATLPLHSRFVASLVGELSSACDGSVLSLFTSDAGVTAESVVFASADDGDAAMGGDGAFAFGVANDGDAVETVKARPHARELYYARAVSPTPAPPNEQPLLYPSVWSPGVVGEVLIVCGLFLLLILTGVFCFLGLEPQRRFEVPKKLRRE